MTEKFFKGNLILILMIILPIWVNAQSNATVKQLSKTYTTYPFSDPDPVPNDGKIYPYFRYDGFTDKPVQKPWKVVELEKGVFQIFALPGYMWAVGTAHGRLPPIGVSTNRRKFEIWLLN